MAAEASQRASQASGKCRLGGAGEPSSQIDGGAPEIAISLGERNTGVARFSWLGQNERQLKDNGAGTADNNEEEQEENSNRRRLLPPSNDNEEKLADLAPQIKQTPKDKTTARGAKQQQGQQYWHHKQTGVKSRPVKLIRHPVENIEHRILLTYSLGFAFKLVAILTGPVLVGVLALLLVPARLAGSLLHLALARMRGPVATSASCDSADASEWLYAPLTYLESYWLKPGLVTTIVLQFDNTIDVLLLRRIFHENVLTRFKYRKFSSCLVSFGLPGFKSQFWHFRGFESSGANEASTSSNRRTPSDDNISTPSRSSSSTTTIYDHQNDCTKVSITQADESPAHSQGQFKLENHIFEAPLTGGRLSGGALRRYVQALSSSGAPLLGAPGAAPRPLWELRLVTAKPEGRGRGRKSAIIFRCQQSLADGKALLGVLRECFESGPQPPQSDPSRAQQEVDLNRELDMRALTSDSAALSPEKAGEMRELAGVAEKRLQALPERKSFVSRVQRASGFRSAILVGPLTILLWLVWCFSRRKNNHLHRAQSDQSQVNKCDTRASDNPKQEASISNNTKENDIRLHWASYSLTRFHQITQMTRSTCSDILLCALSGALRNYLRRHNAIRNPPNLDVSLSVDMGAASDDCATLHAGLGLTQVNLPIPVSVEGLVPRLWELRNTMDELRHSADPWVMLGLKRMLHLLLPRAAFQWLVNKLTLRNASIFVNNLRGPQNVVESWCINLFQKAIEEAQQTPRIYCSPAEDDEAEHRTSEKLIKQKELERDAYLDWLRRLVCAEGKQMRLRLREANATLNSIYFVAEPPSRDIPISFNCISYHEKIFFCVQSKSLLVANSRTLLELFVEQLDQLASTIAKRRSLIAIVRRPQEVVPPAATSEQQAAFELASRNELAGPSELDNEQDDEFLLRLARPNHDFQPESGGGDQDPDELLWRDIVASRAQLQYEAALAFPLMQAPARQGQQNGHDDNNECTRWLDDLEARVGMAAKCSSCGHSVCICGRRKSLFTSHHLSPVTTPNNGSKYKNARKQPQANQKSGGGGLISSLSALLTSKLSPAHSPTRSHSSVSSANGSRSSLNDALAVPPSHANNNARSSSSTTLLDKPQQQSRGTQIYDGRPRYPCAIRWSSADGTHLHLASEAPFNEAHFGSSLRPPPISMPLDPGERFLTGGHQIFVKSCSSATGNSLASKRIAYSSKRSKTAQAFCAYEYEQNAQDNNAIESRNDSDNEAADHNRVQSQSAMRNLASADGNPADASSSPQQAEASKQSEQTTSRKARKTISLDEQNGDEITSNADPAAAVANSRARAAAFEREHLATSGTSAQQTSSRSLQTLSENNKENGHRALQSSKDAVQLQQRSAEQAKSSIQASRSQFNLQSRPASGSQQQQQHAKGCKHKSAAHRQQSWFTHIVPRRHQTPKLRNCLHGSSMIVETTGATSPSTRLADESPGMHQHRASIAFVEPHGLDYNQNHSKSQQQHQHKLSRSANNKSDSNVNQLGAGAAHRILCFVRDNNFAARKLGAKTNTPSGGGGFAGNLRRQSLASVTGIASAGGGAERAAVFIKDEINADVGLRYSLINAPLGHKRSRRYSTAAGPLGSSDASLAVAAPAAGPGQPVHNSSSGASGARRGSLLPFGFMSHNQAIPKSFLDTEANV